MRLLIGVLFSAITTFGIAQEASKMVRVNIPESGIRNIDKLDGKVLKAERLDDLLSTLRGLSNKNGFLMHSIEVDSISDTIQVKHLVGDRYQWSRVDVDPIAKEYLRKAGVSPNRIERKALSPQRLGASFNKVLKYCENNGFPFAEVKMDSVQIDSTSVSGIIRLNTGPAIKIDSLILLGTVKVREGFVAGYTGIKEGRDYNEELIIRSGLDLAQVPFIEVKQGATVQFSEGETKVTMILNQKKASRFDGIIGFLPDEDTGELLVTGDVSVHLENSLKQAEVIDVQWRRLQSNTQDLDASFSLPFVLNSPFGPDARLKIYRRDTTFTDIFGQAGIRYIFNRNNYVRVFADQQVTNLISTAQYENTNIIPEFLDRSITSYGLGFNYSRLDYLLNPARGFTADIDAAVGTKRILENAALPQFIYDSLELTSVQFRSNANVGYYASIVPRLVWHQQFLGGSVLNDQIFNNEATRIGGLRTLRGFNEESIFATTYAIARNELRYQIERNGYVFLLFDQAWYENTSLNYIGARRDTPYAFGAGITVGTRAGIFSLSAAAGSEQGNPVLIRATKFHFGFLSVF